MATDPLAAQLQQATAQKARLDATKASLAGAVDAARRQQSNLASLVRANRKTIAETIAGLGETDRQLREATARQAEEHAAATAARAREVRDRAVLAHHVRMRYMEQDSLVQGLFASDSLSDLMSRSAALSLVSHRGEQLLEQVRGDAAEAAGAETGAKRDAATAIAASTRLEAQRQALQTQTANAAGLIGHLGFEERAATAEITRATAQDVAVAQHIAELHIQQLDSDIAAAQEAAWQTGNYYLANHLGNLPASLSAGASGAPGSLLWAAPGATMSQPFGASPYAFEPPFRGLPHFHTGLDMAAPLGTPVLAAADGVVVSATESTVGYGNHLIIGHSPAMLSLYGHLAVIGVHAGDVVHQGQLIGLMGSTGNSTGPHLHFEVRINNVPTDPAPLLSPPPPAPAARALPVAH